MKGTYTLLVIYSIRAVIGRSSFTHMQWLLRRKQLVEEMKQVCLRPKDQFDEAVSTLAPTS